MIELFKIHNSQVSCIWTSSLIANTKTINIDHPIVFCHSLRDKSWVIGNFSNKILTI